MENPSILLAQVSKNFKEFKILHDAKGTTNKAKSTAPPPVVHVHYCNIRGVHANLKLTKQDTETGFFLLNRDLDVTSSPVDTSYLQYRMPVYAYLLEMISVSDGHRYHL